MRRGTAPPICHRPRADSTHGGCAAAPHRRSAPSACSWRRRPRPNRRSSQSRLAFGSCFLLAQVAWQTRTFHIQILYLASKIYCSRFDCIVQQLFTYSLWSTLTKLKVVMSIRYRRCNQNNHRKVTEYHSLCAAPPCADL